MVSNSDIQIWQNAVNGINESGKADLTQEEWSALSVLNGSLSSGNFQLDESRRSINLLQDNLFRHRDNTILCEHLLDFIDLCYKYGTALLSAEEIQPLPEPTTIAISTIGGSTTTKTSTGGQIKKSSNNYSLLIIIIAAIVLLVGYNMFKDGERFSVLFAVTIISSYFLIFIHSYQKAKERKKEYQPVLVEIFKKRGFSATDITWTNCQYKPKNYGAVNNIVFGVRNGILSFFGGGTAMVKFETKDGKGAFSISRVLSWRKLLKENDDLFLYDGETAKRLFPKKEESQFRHLFDISINEIEDFEGKQIGNKVELLIDCSDNLIKLSPVCNNIDPKIDTVNVLIGALNKIMENNTLSKTKISTINDEINEIINEDGRITGKKQLRTLGKVAGGALLIAGGAAALGARTWSRDR